MTTGQGRGTVDSRGARWAICMTWLCVFIAAGIWALAAGRAHSVLWGLLGGAAFVVAVGGCVLLAVFVDPHRDDPEFSYRIEQEHDSGYFVVHLLQWRYPVGRGQGYAFLEIARTLEEAHDKGSGLVSRAYSPRPAPAVIVWNSTDTAGQS